MLIFVRLKTTNIIHKGKYYIGSTTDLNKRKQEHKTGTKSGNTKFQKAIQLYGFENFKYKVVKTIQFSDIHELWELEDFYIIKHNSIDNGMNVRHNSSNKHK
jgi:group I intron endonuclease